MITFTYSDERFGIRYRVTLDEHKNLLAVEAFASGAWEPFRTYDALSELPPYPRAEIERQISLLK